MVFSHDILDMVGEHVGIKNLIIGILGLAIILDFAGFCKEHDERLKAERDLKIMTSECEWLRQQIGSVEPQLVAPRRQRVVRLSRHIPGLCLPGFWLTNYYRDLEPVRQMFLGGNRRTDFRDEDDARCVICYENWDLHDEVIVLPCTHVFHFDCCQTWKDRSGTWTCSRCTREFEWDLILKD